jgi:hypothetical protein
MRKLFGSYRVAIETVVIVAVLIAIRAVLWNVGMEGISNGPAGRDHTGRDGPA